VKKQHLSLYGQATGLVDDNRYLVDEQGDEIIYHKIGAGLKKLYLEPTSRCNLKCITCLRRQWGTIPEQDMLMDLFENLLEQMESFPELNQVHLGGFGEPLAHPEVLTMIKKLTAAGYRVSLSSNGTLLNKNTARELIRCGINSIFISIDGVEKEAFNDIRVEGDFNQVYENMLGLRDLKKEMNVYHPKVGLEFVLMKKNSNQLHKLPELASELRVATVLVTNLLPCSEEMYEQVLYESPGIEREMGAGALAPPGWNRQLEGYRFPEPAMWPVAEQDYVLWGSLRLPRMYWGSSRKCAFVENNSLVVRRDGLVSPCYALMYDYPYYLDNRKKEVSAYLIGNIEGKHLYKIWNKPEYIRFRHRVRNYNFPSCVDCSNNKVCDYTDKNEDCWGNAPSCADCLWSQEIVRCP